jgi:hypothetical protein
MRSVLATLLLAGCVDPAASPPASGRFTLTGEVGTSQGLVLATSEIVPVAPQQLGDADLYLSIRMVIQLRGPIVDGAFCSKGRVDSLSEIPAHHADCAWSYAGLGANFPHGSVAAGDGYLVRDRFDDRVYKLRIVDDMVDASNIATVVFDIEPAANSDRL